MCGILGWYTPCFKEHAPSVYARLLERLFLLSESRGKEAAGLALAGPDRLCVHRQAVAASVMAAGQPYKDAVAHFFAAQPAEAPCAAIGHARLATNGWQDRDTNNQPVERDGVLLVHNGIIVNDAALWERLGLRPQTQLDTEVIAAGIAAGRARGDDTPKALGRFLEQMRGNASVAFFTLDENALYLATNNSSLYYTYGNGLFVFGSERLILERALKDKVLRAALGPLSPVVRLRNNTPLVCSSRTGKVTLGFPSLAGVTDNAPAFPELRLPRYREVENLSASLEKARDELRRCTRCILPETMPFISFDEQGVCNYCRSYEPMRVAGKEAALAALAPHRSKDGAPDCLVMLSGGRDSCYGLHYAVTELGLNPIAYTYDWGMVTDIARRNAARLCGALGVEHIIVAADIAWKRRNVRKNLLAWLKNPVPGMIPLLMAGDKQYFYYAEQVRRANRLPLTLVSENPLEPTRFKAGFCGVDEANRRIYNIPFRDKLRLLTYYGQQYLINPRYINSTLIDNAFAFFSSYFMKHDLFPVFHYTRWEEQTVNNTLQNVYGWETDPETRSTWRIGDGTAAFYNYAYHTLAGLTENDTLRSNQIREGVMDRATALQAAQLDNRPRWQSMEWYARTIGFNLVEAVLAINKAPRLYPVREQAR